MPEHGRKAAWLHGLCALSRLWAQLRGEGAGGPSKVGDGGCGRPKAKGKALLGTHTEQPDVASALVEGSNLGCDPFPLPWVGESAMPWGLGAVWGYRMRI